MGSTRRSRRSWIGLAAKADCARCCASIVGEPDMFLLATSLLKSIPGEAIERQAAASPVSDAAQPTKLEHPGRRLLSKGCLHAAASIRQTDKRFSTCITLFCSSHQQCTYFSAACPKVSSLTLSVSALLCAERTGKDSNSTRCDWLFRRLADTGKNYMHRPSFCAQSPGERCVRRSCRATSGKR